MPPLVLLLFLLLPLAGILTLTLWPASGSRGLRSVAAVATALQFLLGLLCWRLPPPELQLQWLPRLGLVLDLGLDGLSLPLVLLSSLLSLLAILSPVAELPRQRLFQALLLATNLGVCGAFLARNALLFVLCFELLLIPTTLLVAIWGGPRRAGAAIRFLVFGAISGLSLLAAVLAMGWLNGEQFDYQSLAQASLSGPAQFWILGLLLLGFGIKMPLLPVHGWQPWTYAESPSPVVMLIGGAVSKLGAYGLLRFGLGFLPDAWAVWSPWIAVLGAATAIYGALNAIAQEEIRRLMAYSSLGHMGLLVLAIAAATPLSLQGAVAQMLAHGLIVALLFACVGLIERRTGTSQIDQLSGLMNPLRGLPFTMGMLLLALMAAAGIPGLAGFPAELLVFEGSWTAFPIPTLLSLVASGLTAVYAIRLFNRVGFGRLDNARADWQGTSWTERYPAVVLALLIIAFGIWPTGLVGWSGVTTASLALRPGADLTQLALLEPSPVELALAPAASTVPPSLG
ncbi:MAG: NADH-quinone oxidoreductase subunit M [Synechococcaceae cyanobacterium]|nr:NADH-quinone oxidoreductase subunit M [Synechococcaceae cyanobacterium]